MDYTDLYNFSKDTGIIVPTTDDVKSGIETKFKEIFGTDIDVTAETPMGRLIEALTVIVKSTCGITAQSANQFNLNYATGIYLDSLANIYDIKRYQGTKTRIPVIVTVNSSSVVVPAGSLIADEATNLYKIDNDISISSESTDLTATGTATAVDYGPIPGAKGTVKIIQSSVIGWVGVSNGEPLQIGAYQETDAAFRERIKQTRPIGTGFRSSLLSAVKRIDGIQSARIEENNDTPTQVCNGIILQGHTVYLGVYGTENTDTNTAIANAIVNAKAAGVGMCNDISEMESYRRKVTVEVGTASGIQTDVYFYYAKEITVSAIVRVTNPSFVGTDGAKLIQQAAAAAINAVDIGDTLYGADVALAASLVAPTAGIAEILLRDTTVPTGTWKTNLVFTSTMKPITAIENVTVELFSR